MDANAAESPISLNAFAINSPMFSFLLETKHLDFQNRIKLYVDNNIEKVVNARPNIFQSYTNHTETTRYKSSSLTNILRF